MGLLRLPKFFLVCHPASDKIYSSWADSHDFQKIDTDMMKLLFEVRAPCIKMIGYRNIWFRV